MSYFKKNIIQIILLASLTYLTASCNPVKHLSDDEFLLRKNRVKTQDDKIDIDEIKNIIKQQPNKTILGYRFYLHAYNLPNPKKIGENKLKKEEKRKAKNTKRISKGKAERKKEVTTLGEWLTDVVGEAPVILDTALIEDSKVQISNYLIKNGYFNHTINDSIKVSTLLKKRASIFYTISTGKPHRLKTIKNNISDTQIAQHYQAQSNESLLNSDNIFSIETMDNEREQLTEYLRNTGYYKFTKQYLRFEADTSVGAHLVDLNLLVEPPTYNTDSIHTRYIIGNVNFFVNTDINQANDTLLLNEYRVISNKTMEINPTTFTTNCYVKTGHYYQDKNKNNTYKRLSNLGVFQKINIEYEVDPIQSNILHCNIFLNTAKQQSFSIEPQGTNNSGNFGLSGNITYQHKNVFKHAEQLEIKLKAGIESQNLLTETNNVEENQIGENIANSVLFNTFEIGPEATLRFNKFLLPNMNKKKIGRIESPSTLVKATFNYQYRPDYVRLLTQSSLSYKWNETKTKSHRVSPFEVSLIKINKSASFENKLNEINDFFLQRSYTNHFIASSSYTFIYNNQTRKKQKRHFYNKSHIESAGNLLTSLSPVLQLDTDNEGNNTIAGIRYAQYLKIHNDFRYYYNINEKQRFAARFNAGVGIPLKNSSVLPFEKSYSTGGSNSMRGWALRTLGPGSYQDTSTIETYNNIGDIIIEANFEYQFDLTHVLEGAIFADIGNIWLQKPDALRLNAHFEANRFLKEFAINTGIGIRLDFDFFLIRFDFGIQLKDPAKIEGERWFFEPKDNYNKRLNEINATSNGRYLPDINFSLGIGYPF